MYFLMSLISLCFWLYDYFTYPKHSYYKFWKRSLTGFVIKRHSYKQFTCYLTPDNFFHIEGTQYTAEGYYIGKEAMTIKLFNNELQFARNYNEEFIKSHLKGINYYLNLDYSWIIRSPLYSVGINFTHRPKDLFEQLIVEGFKKLRDDRRSKDILYYRNKSMKRRVTDIEKIHESPLLFVVAYMAFNKIDKQDKRKDKYVFEYPKVTEF